MVDVFAVKQKLYNVKAHVKGYGDMKIKVKVATNLDSWGPTGEQLQEICEATHHYEDKVIVLKALFKRLTNSQAKDWQHFHKALTCFEYLLLHGAESLAEEIKEQIYNSRTLHDFQAVDEKGIDRGNAIREKSKRLVELLSSKALLDEERAKAASRKSKLVGLSSQSSGSSSSYGHLKESGDSPSGSFNSNAYLEAHSRPAQSSTDVQSLSSNAEVMEQQRAIMADIEKQKKATAETSLRSLTPPGPAAVPVRASVPVPAAVVAKPTPPAARPTSAPAADLFGFDDAFAPAAPAAAAHAPAQDLFDPFADAPVAHKGSTDVTDFFAAAPHPPPTYQGHAQPPAPAGTPAHHQAEEDLFGATATFPDAAAPSGPVTTFQDSTFDSLVSLDNIGKKPATAPPPPTTTPSLKQIKEAQKQTTVPQAANFNPFL